MPEVSGTSAPRPVTTRTAPMARGPEPAPADVRAMGDALMRARQGGGERGRPAIDAKAGQLVKGEGLGKAKGEAKVEVAAGDARAPATARTGEEHAPAPVEPRPEQRRESGDGFALPGQPGAPPPLPAPAMPNPQANPAAFAQMLADLWTRENGRGSREVSVRFGERAWPATGARLVRNAAGALDVTLFVGDGGRRYGGDLSGLRGALGEAGVDLGALELEPA